MIFTQPWSLPLAHNDLMQSLSKGDRPLLSATVRESKRYRDIGSRHCRGLTEHQAAYCVRDHRNHRTGSLFVGQSDSAGAFHPSGFFIRP